MRQSVPSPSDEQRRRFTSPRSYSAKSPALPSSVRRVPVRPSAARNAPTHRVARGEARAEALREHAVAHALRRAARLVIGHAERVGEAFGVEPQQPARGEARGERAEDHRRMPAFAEAVVAGEPEPRVQLGADRHREQEIAAADAAARPRRSRAASAARRSSCARARDRAGRRNRARAPPRRSRAPRSAASTGGRTSPVAEPAAPSARAARSARGCRARSRPADHAERIEHQRLHGFHDRRRQLLVTPRATSSQSSRVRSCSVIACRS